MCLNTVCVPLNETALNRKSAEPDEIYNKIVKVRIIFLISFIWNVLGNCIYIDSISFAITNWTNFSKMNIDMH